MKKRVLSMVMALLMLLTTLPATTFAADLEYSSSPNTEGSLTPSEDGQDEREEEDWSDIHSSHSTAVIEHRKDASGDPTGLVDIRIETWVSSKAQRITTAKPCDIVFLLEQSQWMNTVAGTNAYGQERADIINGVKAILESLGTPDYGEHRVAIAGYGRVDNNISEVWEKFSAATKAQFPGKPVAQAQNPSLNTGYYTYENGQAVFHSG